MNRDFGPAPKIFLPKEQQYKQIKVYFWPIKHDRHTDMCVFILGFYFEEILFRAFSIEYASQLREQNQWPMGPEKTVVENRNEFERIHNK